MHYVAVVTWGATSLSPEMWDRQSYIRKGTKSLNSARSVFVPQPLEPVRPVNLCSVSPLINSGLIGMLGPLVRSAVHRTRMRGLHLYYRGNG